VLLFLHQMCLGIVKSIIISVLVVAVVVVCGILIWYYVGGPGSIPSFIPLPTTTPPETSSSMLEAAIRIDGHVVKGHATSDGSRLRVTFR